MIHWAAIWGVRWTGIPKSGFASRRAAAAAACEMLLCPQSFSSRPSLWQVASADRRLRVQPDPQDRKASPARRVRLARRDRLDLLVRLDRKARPACKDRPVRKASVAKLGPRAPQGHRASVVRWDRPDRKDHRARPAHPTFAPLRSQEIQPHAKPTRSLSRLCAAKDQAVRCCGMRGCPAPAQAELSVFAPAGDGEKATGL